MSYFLTYWDAPIQFDAILFSLQLSLSSRDGDEWHPSNAIFSRSFRRGTRNFRSHLRASLRLPWILWLCCKAFSWRVISLCFVNIKFISDTFNLILLLFVRPFLVLILPFSQRSFPSLSPPILHRRSGIRVADATQCFFGVGAAAPLFSSVMTNSESPFSSRSWLLIYLICKNGVCTLTIVRLS